MSEEAETPDKDDEVDGCACDFSDDETTPDEDLPAADGGVA